jgi:hypothetical protein
MSTSNITSADYQLFTEIAKRDAGINQLIRTKDKMTPKQLAGVDSSDFVGLLTYQFSVDFVDGKPYYDFVENAKRTADAFVAAGFKAVFKHDTTNSYIVVTK